MLSIKIWHQKLCWHKTWLKLALQLDVVCINSFYEDSYLLGFQNRTFKSLEFTACGLGVGMAGRELTTLNYCPWTTTQRLSEGANTILQTSHEKQWLCLLISCIIGVAFCDSKATNHLISFSKQKPSKFFITLYHFPTKAQDLIIYNPHHALKWNKCGGISSPAVHRVLWRLLNHSFQGRLLSLAPTDTSWRANGLHVFLFGLVWRKLRGCTPRIRSHIFSPCTAAIAICEFSHLTGWCWKEDGWQSQWFILRITLHPPMTCSA